MPCKEVPQSAEDSRVAGAVRAKAKRVWIARARCRGPLLAGEITGAACRHAPRMTEHGSAWGHATAYRACLRDFPGVVTESIPWRWGAHRACQKSLADSTMTILVTAAAGYSVPPDTADAPAAYGHW